MRSLHYVLTVPSLCCLIVHFHLDLVSNLDRLEMCKLLADIWFQTCFVLKVPLCCAQMTELWVVRFFFPCLLIVQCRSNLLPAKNLLPPHASNMRQKPCRCTPEDWIKHEGGFQMQVQGESCHSWVRSVSCDRKVSAQAPLYPLARQGLCGTGELCALLRGEVPLLLYSLAFGTLPFLG